MTTVTLFTRKQEIAAARLMAMSNAVELNHRYRMARVAAEQEAIRVRMRQNFWRSAYVRRSMYAGLLVCGVGLGWGASIYRDKAKPVVAAVATPVTPEKKVDATNWVPLDAIDVAFAKSTALLALNGASAVDSFAKLNAQAKRFTITGIQAQGETESIARDRATAVVEQMLTKGVDRSIIEVKPVMASGESAIDPIGVRIVAMGEFVGTAVSTTAPIAAGEPLVPPNASLAVLPPPLRPAFEDPPPLALDGPRRSVAAEAKPEPADSQELAQAIQSAAARSKNQRPLATAAASSKEGPGVFVKVPEKAEPITPYPAPKQTEPAKVPSDQPATPYSIVSRLDGAVLVKVGNNVRHIKVGEALPDGKILGKDLKGAGD